MITDLASQDPNVVGVNLSRNHGHQLALTAGLTICQGNRILVIDADLQDPPELLPQMLELMEAEKADVVYGQRQSRSGETAFKLFTASLFYRMIEQLTDVPIPRDTGDFRLMSRRVLQVLLSMPEMHRFTRGMVSWIGFHQVPLLYDRQSRFAGETKYPIRKMVRFALDAITAFSIKPLLLTSLVGLLTALFALVLGACSVYAYIRGSTITGWTSLMAVITLMSSVQLIVLGVFGEDIGRLYEQSKCRPLFVIEQVVPPRRPRTAVATKSVAAFQTRCFQTEPRGNLEAVPRPDRTMSTEFDRFAKHYSELLHDPIRERFAPGSQFFHEASGSCCRNGVCG